MQARGATAGSAGGRAGRTGLALAFVLGAGALCGAGGSAPDARDAAPAATIASREDLVRTLDDYLLAACPGRTLRWELAREDPFPDRAGRRFRLTPPAAITGGRVWFTLEALDPPAATYFVPLEIAWRDSAWVAARPLPAGCRLAAGDAVRELCWHTQPYEALAGGSAPLGLRLTQAVPAGSPLLAATLAHPPEIARGALVRLVYRSPGLLVATRAKALDEGWTGKEIRVQPLDSRLVCAALVRSAEEVEVIAP